MQHTYQIVVCLLFFSTFSCQVQKGEKGINDYYLEWDQRTLVCISDEGGYPRMHRLNDGSLLVAYENRKGDVVTKRSTDEGTSWSNSSLAYPGFDFVNENNRATCRVNIANPEFVQLRNNDIILACNLRPNKNEVFPFSIAIKRSKDNGRTWSDAKILFKASPRFIDGCWEPAFLLLPDGTLHIYFANEFPYQQSNEQEISMIYSKDDGETWSKEPMRISFRKNFRDGMPVAVHDNTNIYVAIEDNATDQFKPYIVKSSILNNWKEAVTANSPDRYSALKTPLPDSVYAGAPYLICTDRGKYVLSYQTTSGRTKNWELSTMEVVISENSSNFRNSTQPFNVPLSKEAKWGSLTDLGNDTIAVISSTNFDSDKIGVWMIKGKIKK